MIDPHELLGIDSTCCITNVNCQLLRFKEILSSKLCKKVMFLKNDNNHREIFFDCALKEMEKNTCMQSLVSIPVLLPVLGIVDFLNGNFNVKLQIFVTRFLKKYSCFSLRFHAKHGHMILFTGKEFGIDP